MRTYSSEAIVLSRKNFSEADRILVLFTKHFGKISVMAKGVRKPKSRKRGAVEVFSKLKFSASKTRGMDIITETESVDNYSEVRKDLKKASVAYFFLETINKLTREEEQNKELHELLSKYLSELAGSTSLKKLRAEYIYAVLVLLGYWPKNKKMIDHDSVLEDVVEREMTSARVGKKVLS